MSPVQNIIAVEQKYMQGHWEVMVVGGYAGC